MKPSRPQANPAVTEPLLPGTASEPAPEETQMFQESSPTTPAPSPPAPAAPSAAAAPAKTAKPTVLGDFRLLAKLGAGGMGTVYKVQQISLDRPAALKVLSRDLAAKPNFVERFYREARVLARLDHPNLIRGFGVGEQHGYHYLAMEFIDGGSLQDWLKKLGTLSVGDAVHIVLACARALEHAHENDIIHRDIKPDNVLLTRKGVVKLADLGLAKALQEDLELTQTGVGAGTPHYIAPEQAANAKYADGRSDIYSLGCMLYYLLSSEMPFKGESTLAVIKAKEAGKFTPLRRLNAEVPSRLELIADKMMASKPEHRYPNCAELIRDLEGLGVANRTLSFVGQLSGEAAAKPPADAAQRRASAPTQPTTPPIAPPKPKGTARPAQAPAAEADAGEGEDRWFVSFTDHTGHIVTRNLGTLQVLRLIESPHFDIRAQASRTLSGNYVPLAQHAPFANAMRSRLSKEKADRKTSNMRSMYEQIAREEEQRLRFRWVHRLMANVSGWLGLLVWLAILSGVAAGLFFLIRFLITWGGSKLDKLWGG